MHLADARGADRLLFDVFVDLGGGLAERGLDLLLDLLERERRDIILQALEFIHELDRHEVRSGGHDLAEFDKRWPEVLEHAPKTDRRRRAISTEQ